MPPHPTHRLNLWLVPSDPERGVPDSAASGLAGLKAEHDGNPRRWGDALLPGGWTHARLDRPSSPHLYGNKQGGFQVRCPTCRTPLVREAAEALSRWRAGKGRTLACPHCATTSPLEALNYRPAAAPGLFAFELRDVQGMALTTAGHRRFEALLAGPFHVIGSRG